jgi:hypothetical protein
MDSDDPVFDSVVRLAAISENTDLRSLDLVVHRNAQGRPIFWHSPLTRDTLRCAICEGGARVRIDP